MQPGDLVKLKGATAGRAKVALWNILEWQLEEMGDQKKIVTWFAPEDVGIVLAIAKVERPWKMWHVLVMCNHTYGWQGKSFFEVVK